jgi:hypothetical protein
LESKIAEAIEEDQFGCWNSKGIREAIGLIENNIRKSA